MSAPNVVPGADNPRDNKKVNLQAQAVYRNGARWNESYYKNPFTVDRVGMSPNGAVQVEAAAMARTDAVSRVAFFSSELVDMVYFGLEGSEAMHLYPFGDYTKYTTYGPYNCARNGRSKVGYTPLCRPWYQAAKNKFAAADTNNDHRLSAAESSANTAQLSDIYQFAGYVPPRFGITLSKALVDENGAFFGVGAIDLSAGELKSAMNKRVYTKGYVYLTSSKGTPFIHPKVDPSKPGPSSPFRVSVFAARALDAIGQSWVTLSPR